MHNYTDVIDERKRIEKQYQEALEKLQAKCPHEHIIPSFFSDGERICADCGMALKGPGRGQE
jgi:hypothetical protein